MKSKLPWFYNLAFLAPASVVKMFMKPYAYEKGMGTQSWVDGDPEKMTAYYGSREAWEAIKSWKDVIPPHWEKNLEKARAAGECIRLDHGWDESKSIYELTEEEIQTAAEFRGGKFLGLAKKEDPCAQYEWECEHGHRFTASLEYVLLGGGWCTECPLDSLNATSTPRNKFISQLL